MRDLSDYWDILPKVIHRNNKTYILRITTTNDQKLVYSMSMLIMQC